ncbi:MAG: 4Fe-4S dicluster domain-containing protein [Planctomycetaceae bacterium]|nr:4Fe-4S dicluster domain-containing protein [Planctomycetaceae bacterium]MCB9949774.1 4Fe-4S dicluster domain-containing protein [Planctomycetaceae bacterium]
MNDLPILGQDNGGCCGGSSGGGGCSSSGGGCSSGGCGSEEAAFLNARRDFLQKATSVTLGGLMLTMLPVNAESEEGADSDDGANFRGDGAASRENSGPVMFAFLIDTEKCTGAGKCMTACRTENNVPEGHTRTWVERFVHYKDGSVKVDLVPETGYASSNVPEIPEDEVERAYFVPKLCNQCVEPPCNQVCPVNAAFESPEGISLVDSETCIGCAYCVQACPYGVRFINPETNNADKCTWCYHRIINDESPACVEACPTGARVFGRLDDPNSEIAKRLAEVPTHVLKEHLGTFPRLRYIGTSSEVV